jgi:hypothetical protein
MFDHCPEHERFDFMCPACREGRVAHPLTFHDTHRLITPCCADPQVITNSPTMVTEARDYGVAPEEVPALVMPIQNMFQGIRNEIFPVTCKCGKRYFLFRDVVNRDKMETFKRELQPYNPRAEGPKPIVRDVLATEMEFARRVGSESNHMIRGALIAKCASRGIDLRRLVSEESTPVAQLTVGP